MKFARRVLLVAGIYGVVVIVPGYFMEATTGRVFPPPITHPEYYYGFIGVALAWQVAFLVIALDPLRYRPLMIPSALEKLCFAAAVAMLYWQGRVPTAIYGFAAVDLMFGILFIVAFVRLGRYA